MISKIISGGQTGADQGALDAAIDAGIPHGGWITKGRITESGPLPDKYQLHEMPTASYPKRTVNNIVDSDGTVIISHGKLSGGSAYTRKMAVKHGRPWIHIDLEETPVFQAAAVITEWIEKHDIQVLNVAGPRATKDPTIYEHVKKIITGTILLLIVHKEMHDYAQDVTHQVLSDWPNTIDDIVDQIIKDLALKDQVHVARMNETDAEILEAIFERYIIERTGESNQSGKKIMGGLWGRLRDTHRLKLVK